MHSTLNSIQLDAPVAPGRRRTISCARSVFRTRQGTLKALIYAVAVLEAFFWLNYSLHAEEGGAGDYIPGLYASLVNITPNQPGLALGSAFLFYTGSAGGNTTLPFGGIWQPTFTPMSTSLMSVSLILFARHFLARTTRPPSRYPMYGWMLKQKYRSIRACSER